MVISISHGEVSRHLPSAFSFICQELTRNANRKSGTRVTAKSPTVKCPMVRPQRYNLWIFRHAAPAHQHTKGATGVFSDTDYVVLTGLFLIVFWGRFYISVLFRYILVQLFCRILPVRYVPTNRFFSHAYSTNTHWFIENECWHLLVYTNFCTRCTRQCSFV